MTTSKTSPATWAVAALMGVLLLGVIGAQWAPTDPADVTLAEFQQIQDGMTYQQVVDIIGKPGVEISRSSLADIVTVMYQWDAGVGIGNMNAMFQNDRLMSKAQFGLE